MLFMLTHCTVTFAIPHCVWITDTDVNPYSRSVSYLYVLYLGNRPASLCSLCLMHLCVTSPLFTAMSTYCVVNLLYSITSQYA